MTEHKFYFYIYDVHAGVDTRKLSTDQMLYVGNAHIDKTADNYFAKIASSYNGQLRDFLKRQGLYQFVPLRTPSLDTTTGARGEEIVTICYYQNKAAYDNIYRLYPQYICTPVAPIAEEFESLYYKHGLHGWYDPQSNTLVEENEN